MAQPHPAGPTSGRAIVVSANHLGDPSSQRITYLDWIRCAIRPLFAGALAAALRCGRDRNRAPNALAKKAINQPAIALGRAARTFFPRQNVLQALRPKLLKLSRRREIVAKFWHKLGANP